MTDEEEENWSNDNWQRKLKYLERNMPQYHLSISTPT
jgi:hypothetical protein